MTPRKWAELVFAAFGPPPIPPHYTRKQVDIEYVFDRKSLGVLQDKLDKLPSGIVRLVVVAEPTKDERKQNGTDEFSPDGLVRRPTLAEDVKKGSDLIGRVFGPSGGYERTKATYRKVSKRVIVQLRGP